MSGSLLGYVVRAGTWQPVASAGIVGSLQRRSAGMLPATAVFSNETGVSGLTDGFGRFALDDLWQGEWLVRVLDARDQLRGEGRVHVFDSALTEITIEIGGAAAHQHPVSVALPSTRVGTGSIRGRVIHTGNRDPVIDASIVIVSGAGPAPDISVMTDIEGLFVLDDLAPGDWLLRALAPSGESGQEMISVRGGTIVDSTIWIGKGRRRKPETRALPPRIKGNAR